ncbi:MAG: serine hydrolase, partial [Gemmatimonadetes bacterium]|nr:serine hydrolase [Gemmatimonadota bacterium]
MVRRFILATVVTIALPGCLTAQSASRDLTPLTKSVFARWDSTTGPGCAVGVDRVGQPRYTRAFGEADLEYDIPNKPSTIFEAGSISKQFTAAATVLLALDGKLNLEDDVRKYVPELPKYERPITIRHLLNHTSGLRDWGEIAGLAGWPRETRVHTHDHVLDILSRQRALNYPPGDK